MLWSQAQVSLSRPLLGGRESQQKVADIFLAREQEFEHHSAHILQFDRNLGLLAESCLRCPQLAAAVREFELGPLVLRDSTVRAQGWQWAGEGPMGVYGETPG
jgi:hypothetical protein